MTVMKRLNLQQAKVSNLHSQATGLFFEKLFQTCCTRPGVALTRMPDGCRAIGMNKLIQVSTPFDWIVTNKGRSALIDTKTTSGKTFAHSLIRDHQVQELHLHEIQGAYAGYVIWFRESDKIIFMPASALCGLLKQRGSITPDNRGAIDLGTSRDLQILKLFRGGNDGKEENHQKEARA